MLAQQIYNEWMNETRNTVSYFHNVFSYYGLTGELADEVNKIFYDSKVPVNPEAYIQGELNPTQAETIKKLSEVK